MIWHPQALIPPPATRRSADRIYTKANQARPPAPSLAAQAARFCEPSCGRPVGPHVWQSTRPPHTVKPVIRAR